METIFDEYLGDLINLTPIKILPGGNKKVITSSIFIPEKPNISDKTYSYFTGLIKSSSTYNLYIQPLGILSEKTSILFMSPVKYE